MPNWCSTSIEIECNDEKKLENLETLIKSWTTEEKYNHENGFGLNWLGNIVENSKIGSWSDIPCRGTIYDMHKDAKILHIYTETAWSPALEMWYLLCNKYLQDYCLTYSAIEPGCGVFETNDPSLEGKWIVDIENYEIVENADDSYVIEFLQELLEDTSDDINYLINTMLDSSDYYASINKWDYIA